MSWSRREFVTASSLAVLGSTLRGVPSFAQQPPPPGRPGVQDVRRNVGTFTARGGTIGYLVTPDAVVVVDSQFADTAPLFLEGMKPKTHAEVRPADQLAPSRRSHRRQQGDAAERAAKIVAHANVPGLQKKAAAAHKPKTTRPTPTRRSTRNGRQTVGEGNGLGEVLRAGAHQRRHRHHSSRAPTSSTWAT